MPAATFWNFRTPRTEYPVSTSYLEDMAAAPLTDRVPDDELLTRVAAGDAPAFTALFRRRQPDIFRFAVHMTGSAATAEDVVQEVFLVVMRDAARYVAGRATVAAWLCGIARNCVRQRLERDRRLTTMDVGDDREPGPDDAAPMDPLASLLRAERIDMLRRAVQMLPVTYREAVALCDLQEMSYVDAAEALGCPVGTVRSRLHRARAMLAARMSAASRSPVARTMTEGAIHELP
jgi:RNA polymerase sigma-70 factor, ECF subfamily